ncbi:hypothetical protein ABTK02_21655, partial [Acinetobacter baumannii]
MDNAGRGNPQIFYNTPQQELNARYGDIFVTLDKWDPASSPQQIERLRARLNRYPDARVTIKIFENGPGVQAPVEVRI